MQPGDAMFYLLSPTHSPYPPHFPLPANNNLSTFHHGSLSNPLYNFHRITPHIQHHFLNPPSCLHSYSTSDEADDQQLSIINERKKRRMISNRESARRSRMRKLKHLDELWSQVLWLRNENHQLMDKLNHASESHDRVVQENAQLKEEASELRQMLADMQVHSPNYARLRDPEYPGTRLDDY